MHRDARAGPADRRVQVGMHPEDAPPIPRNESRPSARGALLPHACGRVREGAPAACRSVTCDQADEMSQSGRVILWPTHTFFRPKSQDIDISSAALSDKQSTNTREREDFERLLAAPGPDDSPCSGRSQPAPQCGGIGATGRRPNRNHRGCPFWCVKPNAQPVSRPFPLLLAWATPATNKAHRSGKGHGGGGIACQATPPSQISMRGRSHKF